MINNRLNRYDCQLSIQLLAWRSKICFYIDIVIIEAQDILKEEFTLMF